MTFKTVAIVLARVGERGCDPAVPTMAYRGAGRLEMPGPFQASIASIIGQNGSAASAALRASLAEQIQRQPGELLLEVVRRLSGAW